MVRPRTLRREQRRVLLTFVGTVDPEYRWTTVGDVMALYNVASRLHGRPTEVHVAWQGDLADLTSLCVPPDEADEHHYDAMIYVCGPLHPGLEPLFSRYDARTRLAVGVSIPAGFDARTLVDAAYVRDAPTEAGFDLALANVGYPHLHLPAEWRSRELGTCLVGEQGEYGQDDGHLLAEKLLGRVLDGRGGVDVSTVLDAQRPLPTSVEIDLQTARTLLTTRLHGSLVAGFHGVRVIAVDQIRGGAKVTAICRKVGIPVVNAWDTSAGEIEHLVERTPSPDRRTRARIVAHARSALRRSMRFVDQHLWQD